MSAQLLTISTIVHLIQREGWIYIQYCGFNMTAPKITLYFDIVSPFAYIAFHALEVSLRNHEGCMQVMVELNDIIYYRTLPHSTNALLIMCPFFSVV